MSDAKTRYNDKTYDTLTIKLHKLNDIDIISAVKKLTDSGLTKSDAIRILFRKAISSEE